MDFSAGPRGARESEERGDERTTAFGGVRLFGLAVGPALAIAVYLALPLSLRYEARVTAGLVAGMATWWVFEVIPVAATALLPLVVLPLTGARTFEQAALPFADRFIFLFMGGFMLALALERWGLHRRFALLALMSAGSRPRMQVGATLGVTAVLSMWVSNTATAAMMLPIAASVVTSVSARFPGEEHGRGRANFGRCVMLSVAYGASIGGVATLIGTPPNALLAGYLETTGMRLGFVEWMLFGVPIAAVLLVFAWLALTRWVFPVDLPEIPGGRSALRADWLALGPLGPGERATLAVFALTASAWVARQPLAEWDWLSRRIPALRSIDDSMIALCAALALFALPVARNRAGRRVAPLDWEHAVRLPWGVLLLFGGGLSLASAMRATELDAWIGSHLHSLSALPPIVLVAAVVALIVFLSEVASNTAVAAAFLPIAGAIAEGMGVAPAMLAVPAAVAASYAFMMPVGTPPNAIVYASGHVRMQDMVRAGTVMNIASIALITLGAAALGPLIGWW